MSDLQRSFAKAKLAYLPQEPLLFPTAIAEKDEYGGEETDELQPLAESGPSEDSSSTSSTSSASSTDTIRPNKYYLENVRSNEIVIHHVYITPPAPEGPLFVLHHGAGSSGLSFSLFAVEMREALPSAGVLSVEARGHGETVVKSSDGQIKDEPHDLSLDLLSSDLSDTIQLVQAKLHWVRLPDIVLVGHSLGGPIVTDVAMRGVLGSAVLGYAVLDVVEGSAMDALQQMNLYLASRPKSFPSLASAIEWHTRSRTLRNSTSARISVPSLLYQGPAASIPEDQPWIWRTNLSVTERYWQNWFTGLSKKFLEAKGGKLLILAGTDRLDKELMIGQMQGKYQLQVFPDAGHFIQEDQPGKTAMVIADFYRRNDNRALVLPPKVQDLLKK
ncbi:MAG: hypothetical protein Q9224_001112 [Gallowayella concinna]